ncbi:DNA ligase 1 [Bacillus rossius redtenbacheri]|uniref:DNA ligase 1 n=1 Tax=Bacillus rossius redtenbacheri TaxID=93214 RepID=UPI002FDD543C
MPAINPSGPGSAAPQRTTFRPPWVKDGPEPLPLPAAPWTLARTRNQKNPVSAATKPSSVKLRAASMENDGSSSSSLPSGVVSPGKLESQNEKSATPEPAPVRKQSKITIVPSMPSGKSAKENGDQPTAISKPKPEPKEPPPKKKLSQERKNKSIDSEHSKEQKPEDCPGQPVAPPMPPPPPPQGPKKAPVSGAAAEKLDALRSRPRKRPDWGTLMKDIESGRKLKHVQCNDRSTPLLPKVKVKESFMYESEKANVHNLLLKEIQGGVSLKRVCTNDRSKPLLEGLRKFRRQLTIEEQIQKATEAEVVEAEPDELDDIDKVRDDLQSTKQMLALELRNKEAVERENKRLLAKLLHLESELEREKFSNKQVDKSPELMKKKHEEDVAALEVKLQDQEKHAKEMEDMYHDVVSQLDLTKNELDEALAKAKALENKLASQLKDRDSHVLTKQPSSKRIPQNKETKEANKFDQNNDFEVESDYEQVSETEEEESDESSEDSEEDKAALQEKRTARELKLLTTKLKALKDKEVAARKERRSLREQLKKQQNALKEEKKKYKELQKEVDKMANLMKDDEEDDNPEDDSEVDDESESDSESESEESEDEESDGDLPEDAVMEEKKSNLSERAKRHENTLTALKKGNYMLKANVDRLKDELFKQKEMSITLQEDLNSVLAELG